MMLSDRPVIGQNQTSPALTMSTSSMQGLGISLHPYTKTWEVSSQSVILSPLGLSLFIIYQLIDWWSFLYSHILCSRALTVFWLHMILNEWLLLFIAHFEYPPKWCTYSAFWLLHGWCHVKLLPFQCVLCIPYMQNVTSLHATPHM